MYKFITRKALLILLLFFTFSTGMLTGSVFEALAEKNQYLKLDIFTKAMTYIEKNYVEDINQSELIYGAIKGMLASLDPYSIFMPPAQYKEMQEETSGEFGGLGIEITIKDKKLMVISPIEDTPAFRAGIKPGDIIVKIDGQETKTMTLLEAVYKMRGQKGSAVNLTIFRPDFKTPKEFVMIRDFIKIVSVTWQELTSGYGYIRVKNFQDRTDIYLQKALDKLQEKKALSGIILDMRNNPGGLLEQAVKVADKFLEKGIIVTTKGRNERYIEKEHAIQKGTQPPYPLVILINSGSASAAEIVAGAIQDHQRGLILGHKSFGKGSVQTLIELDDGSGLKLTIAKYYTPNHRSIQGMGIVPDIEFKKGEKPTGGQKIKLEPKIKNLLEKDNQLHSAFNILLNWKIFNKSQKQRVK